MTAYSAEQIARVCHAANSELQKLCGDQCPSLPWDAETRETRRSAVAGVEAALRGATPEQLHEEWARGKAAAGWRRGALKDPQARTHPSLVPYAELPGCEQVKDAVFAAVARAMSGGRPGDAPALAAGVVNWQQACRNGSGGITVAEPARFMTRGQALAHAAHLVALADEDGEFADYLEAVRRAGGG